MRLLDALVEGWFKRSKEGDRLFYPWGVLGRGYFVPLAEDEEKIKKCGKIWLVAGAIIIFLVSVFPYNLRIVVGSFTILLVSGVAGILYLTRGLKPSTERLTFKENFKTQAFILPAWILWSGLVVCFLFVLASLALLILRPQAWQIAAGGALFFGIGVVIYIWMLVLRRANRSAQ